MCLVASKALISFMTSPYQNRVWLHSFIIYDILLGKTQLLGIGEYCFAKKELEKFAFSWELVTNLLLINNEGMVGTFLPLKRVFRIWPIGFIT